MSNYFRDNPDLVFHMKAQDLSSVAELKEGDFADYGMYPDAPKDAEDACDNYLRVLDIIGEIAGEFIAPRARAVDKVGATLKDDEVTYAPGTKEALERLKKAEVMGFLLPRRYGGINMPMTVYIAAIELISRADAALMLLFGLQGIGEMINRYGNEDQKDRFLPRFASGEVMGAMALTEPDAGTDLSSATMRADQDDTGIWRLNGVKRFITNGGADVSLVMARTEKEIVGARGLSLFIYERNDCMKVRRIEKKLGLNGSPTCELQFRDARAELLGKRKFGLAKYTIDLLINARLAVAAQAIGIAEAAYREADAYAKAREQFGRPIREFPAIYEMLTDMKVKIEAGRALLYETSRIIDINNGLAQTAKTQPERAKEIRREVRAYAKYATLFTPLIKIYATEMANQVCFDAIQIHGGVGYSTEFNVERHYRDVRVTNIYEGTTQLQVVGALGSILGGVFFERLNEYEEKHDFFVIKALFESIKKMQALLKSTVTHVRQKEDPTFQEYHARRIVEMTIDTAIAYLLCINGLASERKQKVAQAFLSKATPRAQMVADLILSADGGFTEYQKEILDEEERVSLPF